MKIEEMNWQMVESLVQTEKRAVLPLGSTEQHCRLSLCTDMILARQVALDAADPLGVPVYPALPYGVSPYFGAFPGSITLRMSTYLGVIEDLLDGMYRSGHRHILIVNGHGGNAFAGGFAQEWLCRHPDARIKLHNWWSAPKTWEKVQSVEKGASHASWMENYPWTAVKGVDYASAPSKSPLDLDILRQMDPAGVRAFIGDGNYGGKEGQPLAVMEEIWQIAVEETRALLDSGWAD